MLKRFSKVTSVILTLVLILSLSASINPSTAHAEDIIPTSIKLYTTSATPVYATPDIFTTPVMYLDRFINVRVTGITYSGYYQVDIGGTYYIPGAYLVQSVKPTKTEKQKALDDLDKFSKAYVNQLQQMMGYDDDRFGLVDVTGDGVPELISGSEREIYTYYDGRAVMIYYAQDPIKLYYSKSDNQLLGKYHWSGSDIWEVYYKDTSLLPWGQFKCYSTNASAYTGNATAISKDYSNDADTRNDMYGILKGILEL